LSQKNQRQSDTSDDGLELVCSENNNVERNGLRFTETSKVCFLPFPWIILIK